MARVVEVMVGRIKLGTLGCGGGDPAERLALDSFLRSLQLEQVVTRLWPRLARNASISLG